MFAVPPTPAHHLKFSNAQGDAWLGHKAAALWKCVAGLFVVLTPGFLLQGSASRGISSMEAFSSGLLKSMGTKVRQLAFNLSETEILVEEATNGDPWGPHGTTMGEIARLCFDPAKQKEVMQVLARRLTDTGEEWRHVYKSLLLLEFLVKQGPMKVVYELQGNLSFLEELQRFEYKDKNGRDHGLNVRNRAKELAALVSDQERVLAERDVAQKNKTKYSGVSKSDVMFAPGSVEGGFGGRGRDEFESKPMHAPLGTEGNSPRSPTSDDNPFEATRKRIERLKVHEEPPARPGGGGFGVAGTLNSPLANKKEPKKLSQVKMNPEIAAAFQKMNITPAKPQQSGTVGNASLMNDDLLGGLEDPPARSAENLLGGGIDTLTAPPMPAGTTPRNDGNMGWSAFESGGAQDSQDPPQASDPFSSMVGGTDQGQERPGANDPFSGLVGDPAPIGTPDLLGSGTNSQANAPLPDFFASPAPMQTISQHSDGFGNAGYSSPSPQFNAFSQAQNPTDLQGIPLAPGMQPMGVAGFPQAGGFQAGAMQGPSGNLHSAMQGFPQAPVGMNSGINTGLINPGMPGTTSATNQTAMGLQNSKEPVVTTFGNQSGAAPMRPGASRPATNRKKDPFADLAVL